MISLYISYFYLNILINLLFIKLKILSWFIFKVISYKNGKFYHFSIKGW
jgi:hypothetical protein